MTNHPNRNIIKLASAEGRTFALGQMVVAKGDIDGSKTPGRIEGFVKSVDGSLIIAKIRVGKTLVREFLQHLDPEPFYDAALAEMERRGISGKMSTQDINELETYRDQGLSATEAGAKRAMDYIRKN